MKKYRLYVALPVVVLFASLVSCGITQHKQKNTGITMQVKNNVLESKLDTDVLFSYIPTCDYVYILNATCSACLSQVFLFTKEIIDNEPNSKTVLLVEEGYQGLIYYYISENSENIKQNVFVVEGKAIFSGDYIKENGLYFNLREKETYRYAYNLE